MPVKVHRWVLRSADRTDASTAEDCVIPLDRMTHGHVKTSVTPVSVSIPWRVDNITSANNNLVFQLKEVTSTEVWEVTLPAGYYTGARLASYIQNELRTMSVPGSATFVQAEFAVSYNSSSNLFTIEASTAAGLSWQLVSGSTTTNLFTQMGFAGQLDTNHTVSETADAHPSLEHTHNVHIALNNVRNTYSSSRNQASNRIILSIPVTVGHGGLVTWESDHSSALIHLEDQPSQLELTLLDDDYNVLDNNEFDWCITFKALLTFNR